MVSAKDLKGMGMERVRHHPIRVEPAGRGGPRVVHFLEGDNEAAPAWPHPTQAPPQMPIKPKRSTREHLSKQSKISNNPTGLRQAPNSTQHRPQAHSQHAFLVELPGEFTDVMEKEAVVTGPVIRQVASYDTFTLPSRMATPQPESTTGSANSQAGLAPVMELPGSTIPPSPIDSFGFKAELPGSTPMVAEKDAGPLPPTELPGSVPYQAELAKRMANAAFCAAR
ncbi:hypothetical protein CAC42_5671 [Sphaceloma murrayae]|uniref:Uncharacterized protein n=1 Tax=Sphaceloma murrayae TaxID=2082308 RepID=A0A2K1QYU1_9PEZI|nr:hypothetical protein CAC42_5671 [Sphaceloma murrayae]